MERHPSSGSDSAPLLRAMEREGLAWVEFADGECVAVPMARLREFLWRELEGAGRVPPPEPKPLPPGATVIPLAEERLVLSKRAVETGRVRIVKRVLAHEETAESAAWQETAQVERVAVERPLQAPVPVRYEGDTLIVPLFEERLVTEKRLFLKEELRITKHKAESRQPFQAVLRREEATVERLPPKEGAAPSAPGGIPEAE
jgi:uncharacterized protein (TIGR02271 family)